MRRSTRLSIKRTNYTPDGTSDEDEPKKLKSEKPKFCNKLQLLRKNSSNSDTDKSIKTTSPPKTTTINKLTNIKLKKEEKPDGSSSESDIENYLQPADQIDLNSTFFTKLEEKKSFEAIESSIFAGINKLSDSESDTEFAEETFIKRTKSKKAKTKHPTPTPIINFQHVEDYAMKLEEAKKVVAMYEANKKEKQEAFEKKIKIDTQDISNLLALGEAKLDSSTELQTSIHSSDYESFSESEKEDWEEVEVKETQEKSLIPKDDLQITVELPTVMRQKKGRDLVASMKRRLNKIRKENQVLVHKVHVLCWVGHGNYLNEILNNEGVLALVLSLIPDPHSYQSNQSLNNLEEILKWYRNTIPNIENHAPKEMTLDKLLKLQIIRKEAFNKKMLVYMFVCLLRSIGIQCRLVISFQVAPLRPPASELHTVSTKRKDEIDTKEQSQEENSLKDLESHDMVIKTEEESKSEIKIKCSIKEKGENSENELETNKKGKMNKKATVTKNTKTWNTKKNLNFDTETNEKKTKTIKTVTNKTEEKENKSKIKNKPDEKPKNFKTNSKQKKESVSKQVKVKSQEVKPKTRSQSTKEDNSEHHLNTKPSTRSKSTSQLDPKENNIPANSIKRKSLSLKRRNNNNQPEIPQIDGANDTDSDEATDNSEEEKATPRRTIKKRSKRFKSLPDYTEMNSDDDFKPERSKKSAQSKLKVNSSEKKKPKGKPTERKNRRSQNQNDDGNDSDYTPQTTKKKKKDDSNDEFDESEVKAKQRIKPKNDSVEPKQKKGFDIWVEVYLEDEKEWVSVDVIKGEVHCTRELHSRASQPITYIVAWNNDNSIKDITQRYSPKWNTVTRKLRIDKKWWNETIKPFEGPKTVRDQNEDEELAQMQLEKPLPTTIHEYKNHPLYVLKRHLLKFEALYPPEPVTLGFVRKEPVYSRDCVHTLRTREFWFKQAKIVKPGEEPYRILKTLKWDKIKRQILKDQPLEVFGEWQIDDYVPPTAENGIVPRNEYGNVELFKSCMLPGGTVHLQLPGLNKLARRMNIDCAPAMVGFDFHSGWTHPVFDGYVVCEEHSESLIAAWYLEQEEQEKREQEKMDKRVYGNWKKLIKGLLIRERLKARYDFGVPSQAESGTKKRKSKGSKFVSKKHKNGSKNESDSECD